MDGTPFLIAGYGLTWVALVWYVWRLERRAREARRALDSVARHAEAAATPSEATP